jgi:hypothetical protein
LIKSRTLSQRYFNIHYILNLNNVKYLIELRGEPYGRVMNMKLLVSGLLCTIFVFSSLELMGYARGGGYGGGYAGRGFDHGNNPYWTNHRYVDPASYYGVTGVNNWYYGQVLGGATTPAESSPGMSDDSDALYNSYLQSNPQRPY